MIYTFPSGEVFISVVTYGFIMYTLVRQCKIAWINTIIVGVYLILCFFIGLSLVYFNLQYPSDVAAGLEFGIVWLSLSIILSEIYNILPNVRE